MAALFRLTSVLGLLVAAATTVVGGDGLPRPLVINDPAAPRDLKQVDAKQSSPPSQAISYRFTDQPSSKPDAFDFAHASLDNDPNAELDPVEIELSHETHLSEASSNFVGSQCDEYCSGIDRDPGWPRKPCLTKAGDRDRGDCPPLRYRMNDNRRAGKPLCYHRFSIPSITCKYSAGWVGGGTPCFGRAQCASEGTWGLDYNGFFGHAHNWLRWTKHHRYQGGEGAYKTDGRTKLVGLFKR